MNKYPKRGEIYWVNLEPTIGSETKKVRPCLIVSSDTGNANSPLVMVAPITSNIHRIYPFEAILNINEKKCKVMLNQARSVDKSRLEKRIIERISVEILQEVDKAIKVVFGIN
jgi:mRNA interferase MazF